MHHEEVKKSHNGYMESGWPNAGCIKMSLACALITMQVYLNGVLL